VPLKGRSEFSSALRASLLSLALVFLGACGRAPAPTPDGITLEALVNAYYNSPTPAEGLIRLTDGEYRREAAPGSASQITVALLRDLLSFGDLDADGRADAAVVLAGSGGGTGTFVSLAAVVDDDGQARHVATAYLGDRVRVTSVAIDSVQITVGLVSHPPTGPLCCPSVETTRRFRLDRETLVELSPLE